MSQGTSDPHLKQTNAHHCYLAALGDIAKQVIKCDKAFPKWTTEHQHAFDSIKWLATSTECLTTIDPALMPDYKIFVTTDASDFGSGTVLSFGPSYNEARPVAYDSRSFKGADLNYPVHEKELLAIPLSVPSPNGKPNC